MEFAGNLQALPESFKPDRTRDMQAPKPWEEKIMFMFNVYAEGGYLNIQRWFRTGYKLVNIVFWKLS